MSFPCSLRSAFRVWLPSWRLTPSRSVPVFFHTGSALGIHPSEHFPLAESPARFRPDAPTYRSTRRCSLCRNTGPARQAPVPGLLPLQEFLADARGFSAASRWMLPWGSPFQGPPTKALTRISPDLLSRASETRPFGHAPQRPRVSIDPRLVLPPDRSFPRPVGQYSPLRVSAPACSRTFERRPPWL
jgi:hypothetical protein